jgi:zinc transporter ZupT
MLKAAALGIDVLILVAVGAYFITEGFGRNLVLDIFLAFVGAASLVMLVGVIRSGNRSPQGHGDVT